MDYGLWIMDYGLGVNLKAVDPPEVLIAFADASDLTAPVPGAVPGARHHFAGLALHEKKVKAPEFVPQTQLVNLKSPNRIVI